MNQIKVMEPSVPTARQVHPYLVRMDEKRHYTNFGPLAEEFSERLLHKLNIESSGFVALASSGTAALQGAVSVFDRNRWECPDLSFAASAIAIQQASSEIAYRDVSLKTWRICPSRENEDSAVGILEVSPFGSDLFTLGKSPNKYRVIDAATSLGAGDANSFSLDSRDAVVFSLHATKIHGIGEGGVVIFGGEEKRDDFQRWTNFGFSRNRVSELKGTNAKFSEIQAAYGLAMLDRWDEDVNEWQRVNLKAREIDIDLNLKSNLEFVSGVTPNWVVELRNLEERTRLEAVLADSDIETKRWWPTQLSLMPALRSGDSEDFPNSAGLVDRLLGLPMHPFLGDKEFERIRMGLTRAGVVH